MVKNREEFDEEGDQEDDQEKFFFEHPDVGIDWVKKHPSVTIDKDQHVERLHPKYWLSAARSLQYAADIIFEHEQPFVETLHAVEIGKLDKSHLARPPNLAPVHLLYGFAFENLLKGIISLKIPPSEIPPCEAQQKKRKGRSKKHGEKEDSTSG